MTLWLSPVNQTRSGSLRFIVRVIFLSACVLVFRDDWLLLWKRCASSTADNLCSSRIPIQRNQVPLLDLSTETRVYPDTHVRSTTNLCPETTHLRPRTLLHLETSNLPRKTKRRWEWETILHPKTNLRSETYTRLCAELHKRASTFSS